MSSSSPLNTDPLPYQMASDRQRVEKLELLLDKLERDSLSLVRQSEVACDLLGARIEEPEERL